MLTASSALVVTVIERRLFARTIVDGLVIAILLGMLLRTAWSPSSRFDAGIQFAAKNVLEVAVLLLGIAVDLKLLLLAGPALAIGIVVLVVLGIATSYAIGRLFGLGDRRAVLIACGNAICGNSAIAALAPVIGADSEEVASSIAFTAILGVFVVIGLPLMMQPLGFSLYQYGVFAGLTVYAVPQVLAAAFPVSTLSGQVGTLVKLVRVLMLGPVVLFFALRQSRSQRLEAARALPGDGELRSTMHAAGTRITQFVPWFIIGFMALAALRAAGLVPAAALGPARAASAWLTIIAMAALGLGCDLRVVLRASRPVIATVAASLLVLLALSIALIRVLGIR